MNGNRMGNEKPSYRYVAICRAIEVESSVFGWMSAWVHSSYCKSKSTLVAGVEEGVGW